MVSIIVAIISLIGSCIAIYSNFIKDLLTSYGHGHGVGMSQYGAKALAENGYTYKQILQHYFTGVEIH